MGKLEIENLGLKISKGNQFGDAGVYGRILLKWSQRNRM
jgi:hypothetical protein